MHLSQQLQKLHKILIEKRLFQEAQVLSESLPSFFRRNYDYGEGLYHGDMSDKESVGDFLKKHHEKGPNWPKKKKKAEIVVEASPRMETLKKNKRPLTDEERQKVMDAGAVWHFSGDEKPTPGIWKAEVNGKTWYVCNTHRAYQAKPTLSQAFKAFEFIKTTASTR